MYIRRYGLGISALAVSLILNLGFAEARTAKDRFRFVKQSAAYDYSVAQIAQKSRRLSQNAKLDSYRQYMLLRQIEDIDIEYRPEKSSNIAEAIIAHPSPQTAKLLAELGIPAFDGVPPIAFLGQRKSSSDGY